MSGPGANIQLHKDMNNSFHKLYFSRKELCWIFYLRHHRTLNDIHIMCMNTWEQMCKTEKENLLMN